MYWLPRVGLLWNELLTKRLISNFFYNKKYPRPMAEQNPPNQIFNCCKKNWHWIHKQGTHHLPNISIQGKLWGRFWRLEKNFICSISLNWSYKYRTVDLSMLVWIKNIDISFNIHSKSITQIFQNNLWSQNAIFWTTQ